MLTVEWTTSNYAMLDNGDQHYIIVYCEDRLRKYSELLIYPSWTMERVLKELREDLELEIGLAFPNEEVAFIEGALDSIMPYASANIHDPRTNK